MPKCEAYPFFGNIFCEATWEHAFSGRYLSNILLFPGFLAIEDSAFKNNKLTSVTLPEGLISIGKDAFAHNDGISAITIPGTVTYVGAPLLKILLLGPTLRWGEGGIKVILAGSTTRTEKTAAVQQLYAMPPKLVGIFIIKNIKNGL
ncbi:MAG: leucine-rich repeat domain-containing protein [Treponema sp.]|nr:leucine-rich repeat domain-containing protein [Treponema sp.]